MHHSPWACPAWLTPHGQTKTEWLQWCQGWGQLQSGALAHLPYVWPHAMCLWLAIAEEWWPDGGWRMARHVRCLLGWASGTHVCVYVCLCMCVWVCVRVLIVSREQKWTCCMLSCRWLWGKHTCMLWCLANVIFFVQRRHSANPNP